jgi:hypothetical protein
MGRIKCLLQNSLTKSRDTSLLRKAISTKPVGEDKQNSSNGGGFVPDPLGALWGGEKALHFHSLARNDHVS